MKKSIFIIALALVAAACAKESLQDETGISKGLTVFTGEFVKNSRITIGDKDGNYYKALWAEGDELAVVNASTGDTLGTAKLTDGVGANTGVFTLEGEIADGTSVILKYGAKGVVTEQIQASAGKSDLSKYTVAASEAVTVSGGKAGFTLTHNVAIVKVSVASTALAGAKVNAVIIRSIGGILSSTDKDYARVSLTTPLTLGETAQDIWLTAAPSDLSGREIDIAFEISNSGVQYTLPVAFNGAALKSNTVNSFTVNALSDAKCVEWYEPHDTRLTPGEGYAYGDANCYFIQCKNGSTYTGATYTPNSTIPGSVDIIYKARGNFLNVTDPNGVSFTWMKLGDTDPSTGTGTGAVYTIRTANYSSSAVDPTKFTFVQDAANYKVTVNNTGAYAGAPVLLMVKNGTVLWAWSFWNVAADGTSIEPLAVKNGSSIKILPMDIGQATTQFATWIANKNGDNPDPVYRSQYRYQWGRPVPVFWNYLPSLNIPGTANNKGNVPGIVGPVSLKESLAHPCAFIVASATETGKTIDDWLSVPDGSLWGNMDANNNNHVGDKSIYDPCPKGYRVADRNTLNTLRYGVTWDTSSEKGYPHYKANNGTDDIYFIKGGYYQNSTATNSGNFAIQSMGGANTGLCIYGLWWTNYAANNTNKPSTMANQGETTVNPGVRDNNSADNKARGFFVRCQVDEDNR